MTTLSIVIPCLDPDPQHLEDCFQSLVPQLREGDEAIVQDGGTTGPACEILEKYSDRVSWIQEQDSGQTDAINRALERATGDVIGWLNADDIYLPGALQSARDIFDQRLGAHVVYGDFSVVDGELNQLRRYRLSEWEYSRFLHHGCYVFSGAFFMRSSVVARFGPLDPSLKFCMDYEYFLRIGRDVRAVHVDAELGALRYHAASKSGTSQLGFFLEASRLRRKYSRGAERLATVRGDLRHAVYGATTTLRFSKAYSKVRKEKTL